MGRLQQEVLASPRREERWIEISDAAFLHASTASGAGDDEIIRFWGMVSSLRSKSKAIPLPFSQCEQTDTGLRFFVQRADLPALFGFDVMPSATVPSPRGFVQVEGELWDRLSRDMRPLYLTMEKTVQSAAPGGTGIFAVRSADLAAE